VPVPVPVPASAASGCAASRRLGLCCLAPPRAVLPRAARHCGSWLAHYRIRRIYRQGPPAL